MSDGADEGRATLAAQSSSIRHVLGIMSGKGGVGKSLVTALLATALREAGHAVGILDADITGPSIPRMFGVSHCPETCDIGIFPAETRTGIRLVSINLFLQRPDEPVIWRGPLISNTIKQFWQDVFWGDLEYLLVDLPPGTSDAPLTVMQSLPVDCVVIVTSPQQLATMVVRKAVSMCRKMEVPVLGLVQNMAYFECPSCGKRVYPFGTANGEDLAASMGVVHLLDIPMDADISRLADDGLIETYAQNPFLEKSAELCNALESSAWLAEARTCDDSNPLG